MSEEDDEEAFRKQQERMKQMMSGGVVSPRSAQKVVIIAASDYHNRSSSSGGEDDDEAHRQQMERLKQAQTTRPTSPLVRSSSTYNSYESSSTNAYSAENQSNAGGAGGYSGNSYSGNAGAVEEEPDEEAIQRHFEKIMNQARNLAVSLGNHPTEDEPDDEAIQKHYERIMNDLGVPPSSVVEVEPSEEEIQKHFDRIMGNLKATDPKSVEPDPAEVQKHFENIMKETRRSFTVKKLQSVRKTPRTDKADLTPGLSVPVPLLVVGTWADKKWTALVLGILGFLLVLSFILHTVVFIALIGIVYFVNWKVIVAVNTQLRNNGMSFALSDSKLEQTIGFFELIELVGKTAKSVFINNTFKTVPELIQASLVVGILISGVLIGIARIGILLLIGLLLLPLAYEKKPADIDKALGFIFPDFFPWGGLDRNDIAEKIQPYKGQLGAFFN